MGNYTLGSYEEWARVMGGILDFIGVNEFLGNLSSNDEVNSAEAEWRGFVNLWWAFLRDKEVTIKELYELAMENDLLNGVMGDGRDMSQRTKLGLALGNREGQVWDGKKIVIPKDESGRRRVHRLGGVLYHLIDIGDDPTGSRPPAQIDGAKSDVEAKERTHPRAILSRQRMVNVTWSVNGSRPLWFRSQSRCLVEVSMWMVTSSGSWTKESSRSHSAIESTESATVRGSACRLLKS